MKVRAEAAWWMAPAVDVLSPRSIGKAAARQTPSEHNARMIRARRHPRGGSRRYPNPTESVPEPTASETNAEVCRKP
jgi:hypothetical protein